MIIGEEEVIRNKRVKERDVGMISGRVSLLRFAVHSGLIHWIKATIS